MKKDLLLNKNNKGEKEKSEFFLSIEDFIEEKIRNQKSCILKICVFPCLRGKYEGVAF